MIHVQHLRMEYGDTVALENLCLHVERGEVFGLIGPNGAGKTTLIRVLATLLEPTYGDVKIAGIDALARPLDVHPVIAYMSDFFAMYDEMRVWEYLDHFARCYQIPPTQRSRLIDEVLDLVSLTVRRDSEISELSRGMRQRLCFAKSLLHEPQLLLLDEPASGLDPAGRLEFREMIKQLHAMGRTVLISSHILTEMTGFCTAIGILEQGQLLKSGRVDRIVAELQAGIRLQIEPQGEKERLERLLNEHEQVQAVTHRNGRLECAWSGRRDELPSLHRTIVDAGVPLIAFSVVEENLEDIYMRISGHRTS